MSAKLLHFYPSFFQPYRHKKYQLGFFKMLCLKYSYLSLVTVSARLTSELKPWIHLERNQNMWYSLFVMYFLHVHVRTWDVDVELVWDVTHDSTRSLVVRSETNAPAADVLGRSKWKKYIDLVGPCFNQYNRELEAHAPPTDVLRRPVERKQQIYSRTSLIRTHPDRPKNVRFNRFLVYPIRFIKHIL